MTAPAQCEVIGNTIYLINSRSMVMRSPEDTPSVPNALRFKVIPSCSLHSTSVLQSAPCPPINWRVTHNLETKELPLAFAFFLKHPTATA